VYAFSWIWAGGYEGVSRTMAPESVVSGPWPLFSQPPLYGQVLSFSVSWVCLFPCTFYALQRISFSRFSLMFSHDQLYTLIA